MQYVEWIKSLLHNPWYEYVWIHASLCQIFYVYVISCVYNDLNELSDNTATFILQSQNEIS